MPSTPADLKARLRAIKAKAEIMRRLHGIIIALELEEEDGPESEPQLPTTARPMTAWEAAIS